MALAALIVSIVAGLFAAVSALYARRVAVVEEARRLDETRPRFDAESDGPLGGAEAVLLTYTGPEESLDGVHLIVRSPQTPDGFALCDEQGDSVTELALGAVTRGSLTTTGGVLLLPRREGSPRALPSLYSQAAHLAKVYTRRRGKRPRIDY